jgi:hypothetical protein
MAELAAVTAKPLQPALQPAAGAAAHTLGAHIDDAREAPELPARPPSTHLSRPPSLVPGSGKEAEAAAAPAFAALPPTRLPSDVASRLPEDRSRREHTLTDASRSSPAKRTPSPLLFKTLRVKAEYEREVLSLLALQVQMYKY